MVRHHRRYCTVCASNQNRSMEAHLLLSSHNYFVRSYGTSSTVKLPGPAADKPNIFQFNTPYKQILQELTQQNEKLYQHNGVIKMLQRNAKIKLAPERWQNSRERFDVVFTFEDRVFEAVLDDFAFNRSPITFHMVHIINVDTKDTHTDAAIGARNALELCSLIDQLVDLESEIPPIIERLERAHSKEIMYSVEYY